MNKKLNVSKVTPENQSIYAVDAYKPYLRKLENSDKIIEAFIQFLEQRWVKRYEHFACEQGSKDRLARVSPMFL